MFVRKCVFVDDRTVFKAQFTREPRFEEELQGGMECLGIHANAMFLEGRAEVRSGYVAFRSKKNLQYGLALVAIVQTLCLTELAQDAFFSFVLLIHESDNPFLFGKLLGTLSQCCCYVKNADGEFKKEVHHLEKGVNLGGYQW